MPTYDFDAFGNPIDRPLNGKRRPTAADAAHFYCDGVYDPALALYHQPVQSQSVGLFTSIENQPGPVHDPVSLAKFMYAGHAPVDCIDPA